MDSFDSKLAHTHTYWWITSLATSVTCCSILFVVFASYIFQIKEDLAVAKVRFDITESRLNEVSIDLQMLNHRSMVQQIQIIPAPGAPPSSPTTADTTAPAAAAATVLTPPTPPSITPSVAPTPSAPVKH